MSKYIIKNCPNITYCPSHKEYECGLCLEGENYKRKCSDNTNCVLKQIVELYKEQTQFCKDCSTLTCEDCNFSTNGFAEEVIELLDIQEVE